MKLLQIEKSGRTGQTGKCVTVFMLYLILMLLRLAVGWFDRMRKMLTCLEGTDGTMLMSNLLTFTQHPLFFSLALLQQ